MGDTSASPGIPAGSLGAEGKASSRGTPQQRCCFAYANELMASLGLAVTQQLRRGSPPVRGSFSHGCRVGDYTPVHTCVQACLYIQPCAPWSLVGWHKRWGLPRDQRVALREQVPREEGLAHACAHTSASMHTLAHGPHVGTRKSARASAAAVAGGDVHARTRLHTHRRVCACSALIHAHPYSPGGVCMHAVNAHGPRACPCIHWGN